MRLMRYSAVLAVMCLLGNGTAWAGEPENAAADRKYAECNALSDSFARRFDKDTFDKLDDCHRVYRLLAATASGCKDGSNEDDCISKWRATRDLVNDPVVRALIGSRGASSHGPTVEQLEAGVVATGGAGPKTVETPPK